MDDFFTPVSTTYTNPRLQGASPGGTRTSVVKNNRGGNATSLTTPEEALEILKSKPDYSDFIHVLKYLSHPSRQFSLFTPGPRSSSITTVLVDEIAPNYWPIFQESLKEKSEHLQPGSDADVEIFCHAFEALAVKSVSGGLKRPDLELHIDIYLDLLSALLGPDDALESLYIRSTSSPNTDPASHASKDIVSLLGRGVIVSTAAEADFLIGRRGSSLHWVSDAKQYVEWLARSMSRWMKKSPPEKSIEFCAEVLVHSWSIGYSDDMHRELFTSLLLQGDAQPQALSTLLMRISPTQRDKASYGLLSFVSRLVQDVIEATEPSLHNSVVSAAATMIKSVLPCDVLSKGSYIAWLVPEPSDSMSDSNVWIRRAIIAGFSDDVEFLADLLNKALALFGDPLWIGWAPLSFSRRWPRWSSSAQPT
ncbi:unnamed protein product [Parascedosporium putredinis]|uniref:Uncharacterized protein n=1 Tax=Parascedosporium putredinis TaxID=1442378 RepID=A0A9P1H5B4_9PEZI|nr:unnamed protein product [Parascedosporium putredinis]CAI7997774.1 unnamed protein product [Parascedosporium putredinis]